MRRALAVAACSSLTLGVLGACRTEQTFIEPDPHLERMLKQEKHLAYEEDPALPRGMVMMQPPEGTLPVDAPIGDPLVTTGVAHGRWAERIPLHVDRAMLERGRNRFETFCAACHGILGDAHSVVAEKMAMRRPKDLQSDEVRGYPPGRVFQAIRQGYGLMPSYDVQLSIEDSWAVVAYVRALQVSRRARVADLPPDVRGRLAREAP